MAVDLKALGIEQMERCEKLDLIAAIWDSLSESEDDEVPAWHQEELKRRLESTPSSPSVPWEDVQARLRART